MIRNAAASKGRHRSRNIAKRLMDYISRIHGIVPVAGIMINYRKAMKMNSTGLRCHDFHRKIADVESDKDRCKKRQRAQTRPHHHRARARLDAPLLARTGHCATAGIRARQQVLAFG
jgi:hypothetical protein